MWCLNEPALSCMLPFIQGRCSSACLGTRMYTHVHVCPRAVGQCSHPCLCACRMMWAAGAVAAMSSITFPAVSALVSRTADADQQGTCCPPSDCSFQVLCPSGTEGKHSPSLNSSRINSRLQVLSLPSCLTDFCSVVQVAHSNLFSGTAEILE